MEKSNNSANGIASPLVSVIVPAYNAELYFEECLQSIEGQTYANLEIIVVDDGSTDATLSIALHHKAQDPRIKVFTQQNQYAGIARNKGMAEAEGDFLLFLDADDLFEPAMVEGMVRRAQRTSADVTMCRAWSFTDDPRQVSPMENALNQVDIDKVYENGELARILFQFCSGWAWDKLFRAEFIRKTGLQFQGLRTTNDAYFVFIALALANKVAFVDEYSVRHRVGNSQSLEGSREKSADNALIAVQAIGDGLRERGVYDQYRQSYLNWVVSFSVWNVYSLSQEGRKAYISKLVQILPDDFKEQPVEGFYYEKIDGEVAQFLRSDHVDGIAQVIDMALELRWRRDEMGSMQSRIDSLSSENYSMEEELRNVLESRTFKIGKAIMALPCFAKDAITAKSSSN